MIPPMMVQPFVENVIRHGFMHLQGKGKLTITFDKDTDDTLKCTIVDNGVGREAAARKQEAETHSGRPHSTSITENRIRLFNPPEAPDKFRIVYTDLSVPVHPHGLKVELYLPVEA
jgi:LytS/YehU family sensor histidine kinase